MSMHFTLRWSRNAVAGALIAVALAGCGGNDDGRDDDGASSSVRTTEEAQGTDRSGDGPQLVSAGAVLQESSERAQDVTSFRSTFAMAMDAGGFLDFGIDGEMAYSDEKAHMTIDVLGMSMEMLIVLPDMYMRFPGDDQWYVIDTESFGIELDGLRDLYDQRGFVDQRELLESMGANVEELPQEAIDGETYRHYRAELTGDDIFENLPEGLVDPELMVQAAQTLDAMGIDVWIDPETYLARRFIINVSMDIEGQAAEMTMTMEMFDYNEPIDIPDVPADAVPVSEADPAFAS
ncbi:MAG: hypothetical protein WEC75_06865 [Dehalococcoidia bacterium]